MKELTTLCVRIAGLILIVITMSYMPVYYMALMLQQDGSAIANIVLIFISLFSGVMMFKHADKFSDIVINVNPNNIYKPNLNEYFYLGIKLIGITLFILAASDMIYYVLNYIILAMFSDTEITTSTFDYAAVLAAIVELTVSVSLVYKTKNIMAFIGVRSDV